MRRRVVTLALALILAGCSASSSDIPVGTTPTSTPDAAVCEHLRDLKALVGDLQDGTVTHDEAVARLAELQASFEDDASILKDQGAPRAPLVDDVAVAIGQLKVAIDNAGSSFGASTPVTDALVGLAHAIGAMGPCQP